MSDRPRLYTAAEAATELRMSVGSLRQFLSDLGFTRGTRGARRMFTPGDLDWLVEQRSWLLQAAGGTAAKAQTIAHRTVHVRAQPVDGLAAQERTRELIRELTKRPQRQTAGKRKAQP